MPTWAASNAKVALPQNSAARMRSLGGIPARAQGRLAGPFSTKSGSAAALAGTELIRRRQ
jgi:hypothetical protein